jgi:hypothetical protein
MNSCDCLQTAVDKSIHYPTESIPNANPLCCHFYVTILSQVKWLNAGFELVIVFIGLLKFVTTINYNSFMDLHT